MSRSRKVLKKTAKVGSKVVPRQAKHAVKLGFEHLAGTHELKQVLGQNLGNLELLKQRLDQDSDFVEYKIDKIIRSLGSELNRTKERIVLLEDELQIQKDEILTVKRTSLFSDIIRERGMENEVYKQSEALNTIEFTPDELEFRKQLENVISKDKNYDRSYLDAHLRRFYKTFKKIEELAKDIHPDDVILDAGTWSGYVPMLRKIFPKNRIVCISDLIDKKEFNKVDVISANLELEKLQLEDSSVGLVLLLETIEHFSTDPMFFLEEANRVMRPGGKLLLTTPNMNSWRALGAVLTGYSPYTFGKYTAGNPTNTHCHEYTPREINLILDYAGFQPTTWTDNVYSEGIPPLFDRFFDIFQLDKSIREDCLFSIGEKTGPVKERYPEEVYAQEYSRKKQ